MKDPYFDLTVPVLIKNLENAKNILVKSFDYSKSIGMTEEEFLNSRLAPDMFPLLKQVQLVTDHAKGAAARLSGGTPIIIEDNETTVAELLSRIDTVSTHLKTFTKEQYSDAKEAMVVLPYFPGKYLTGQDYLTESALPNFFFHLSMLYAIGRMIGAPLGKTDFVGGLPLKEAPVN